MNKSGIVITLLCSLAAAAVVLWERRKVRKTMEEIERMLDAAMTGSFSEITFDESPLKSTNSLGILVFKNHPFASKKDNQSK